MEILLTIFCTITMLIVICFIGSLVLAKDTKDFHMHFGLLKGFDISGSFFDKDKTPEN